MHKTDAYAHLSDVKYENYEEYISKIDKIRET